MTDAGQTGCTTGTATPRRGKLPAARTDRFYAGLTVGLWMATLGAAVRFPPLVDAGRRGWGWSGGPTTGGHAAVAGLAGGLVAVATVVLTKVRPGAAATRHVISAGLMSLAALLCRQTCGHWETDCGVLVILALLGRYQDWRVIVTGIGVMAVDHATRGLGPDDVATDARWVLIQHLAWAAAEATLLVVAAVRASREATVADQREAELARTNGVLAAQQEASPDGVLITDECGRVVRFNARFADLYGLAAGPHDADTLLAATSDRFADPAQERARIRSLRADPTSVATQTVPLADGRTLERYTHPAVGVGGQPLGRVWYLRDVTDRRAAEEQAALNRKLALVASRTDNAVVITDPGGHVEWVNQGFTRVTGYTLAEVAGQKPGKFLQGPETDPATVDLIRAKVAAGEGLRTEIKNYDKSGRPYWLAIDIQPVRDPAGRITNFVAIESDVTDRRQAEADAVRATDDLRRTGGLLRSLIDSIPDLIFYKDANTRYLGCNKAFAAYVGRTPAAVVGLTDDDLFPPEVAAGRLAVVRELMASKRPKQFEETLAYPDGGVVEADTVRTPLIDAEGRVLGVLGVSRDITDRKAAEREVKVAHDLAERSRDDARAAQSRAEMASRAKSDFLANMSHEIRTPLNGVVGMVELLEGTPLDERQRQYAAIMRASAEALLSLINDVLDFSKIEAGKLELEVADFDLHAAVEEAVAVMAPRAAKKGLQLASRFDPAVPRHARGDAARLRQVIYNLVNNAVKFTGTGAVTVTVAPDPAAGPPGVGGRPALRVAVADTGVGIPPDRLDRLFKSFSQVDTSTTRKYGGTGLGLAISKQLVELMGGRIGVDSVAGEGSTFWFVAHLADAVDDPAPPAPLPDLHDQPVLIIDANPTHANLLRDMLAGWHLRPTIARTTAAAAAAARPVRLILCDLDSVGGPTAAGAVAAAVGAPVLALRSVGSPVSTADAAAAGLAGIVDKPIRQSALFDQIQTALADAPVVRPSVTVDRPPARTTGPLPPPAGNRHLLVADDNEINQIVAAELLRKAGWTCDLVSDGRAAVAAVAEPPPGGYAGVLMDCQMPELDGLEATRQIRRAEAATLAPCGRHLPIVALTANAVKGDREACLAAGMDGYLSKPLHPPELYALVGKLFDAPAGRAA